MHLFLIAIAYFAYQIITMVLYDTIGKGYNTTRKADPYLTGKFYDLLAPVQDGIYLDAGCGTGNYLHALSAKGLSFYGIDPSETMLEKAMRQNPTVKFTCCKAEDIPFDNHFFNGVTAILTMHHWDSIPQGLKEIYRVLKPGGRFVSFSFTPEQVKGYWLAQYFPGMIDRAANTIPALSEMERFVKDAGFGTVNFEKYFVRPDLEDHFMYSCKHEPERCLIPEMRENTSGFTALANQAEVAAGLLQLEADISTGKINKVIKDHENELGDYLFITAQK